jgi:hypothetical protein
MPENAPLTKVSNTRHHGAEVVLCGMTYQEAYAKAVEIQEESGATFIHPFDDEQVIAGQGTIALELLEQEPELEAVLAEEQANVIEVYHERSFPGGPIDTTEVLFTLETRGREHAEAVLARLEHDGFYPEEIR